MIAVIDYGMGNLRSVQKALEEVGAKTKVTSRPSDLKACDKIVFPGVGAFGDAMDELKRRGLVDAIKSAIEDSKPFLGLCLGLQLLFEKSEEAPGVKGLGVFKGEVKRFRLQKESLKVPHMGWNSIDHRPCSCGKASYSSCEQNILRGVKSGSFMYFVHSYYVQPKDRSIILTTTDYGAAFVSGVCKDNVYGLQFHPEKSQALGLKILKNFVSLN
jgi:imidazole glycerol phosphate synthase, glutamine amidotransferase subunit